jgi:hypothetical protein
VVVSKLWREIQSAREEVMDKYAPPPPPRPPARDVRGATMNEAPLGSQCPKCLEKQVNCKCKEKSMADIMSQKEIDKLLKCEPEELAATILEDELQLFTDMDKWFMSRTHEVTRTPLAEYIFVAGWKHGKR